MLFRSPGESDLTSHVDFEALAKAIAAGGGRTHAPITQRDFLLAMGIAQRAEVLASRADVGAAEILGRAVQRLTGEAEMGKLFKVMAATSPPLTTPYPFGLPHEAI